MLGHKCRDRITGFEGVVTGVCEYLTGCNQVLIVGCVTGDGKSAESNWFDVQRVEQLEGEPIQLDNGKTPGFDVPAPIH